MITIKITDRSIRMNGHACQKSPDGIDRVCAAVSALTCNLINSLKDLTGDRIRRNSQRNDCDRMGRSVRRREASGGFMVPGDCSN